MTERGLTQEEIALLGHFELVLEQGWWEQDQDEEHALPAGFRERLALGDLSW